MPQNPKIPNKIKLQIPASTSNLGSGFDILGAALNLYNEFELQLVSNPKDSGFILKGFGKDKMPADKNNLIWQTMDKTFKLLKCSNFSLSNFKITITSNIPLGSGLGSSATAIIAGIAFANILCNSPLNKDDIAQIATEIEGHPDNAVPSVFGGLCLCYKDASKTKFITIATNNLKLVVINPSFQISTIQARKSLPKKYPIQDIVFNLSRISLLSAALTSKNYNLLKIAFEDKIHQPYRIKNIPHAQEIFTAAINAGAYAPFISGSGPSLAAFVNQKTAPKVCKAMTQIWKKNNIKVKSFILDFNKKGLVTTSGFAHPSSLRT
jgi:homoserine kinase